MEYLYMIGNAIVHNDYTKGVPLIEISSDRIVVTSSGGLVEGLAEEDFYKCRSMLRSHELMRVFVIWEL
jgi:predicted HTH transcriptional regulator